MENDDQSYSDNTARSIQVKSDPIRAYSWRSGWTKL